MLPQDVDLDGLREAVGLLELLKGVPELLCLLLVGVVGQLLLVAHCHHLSDCGQVSDEDVAILPKRLAQQYQLLLLDHLGDGFPSEVVPWPTSSMEGEVLVELGHLLREESLHDPEAVIGDAELNVERHGDIELEDGGVILGLGKDVQWRVLAGEIVPEK